MNDADLINVNGVEYIKKDSIKSQPAVDTDGMSYAIIRSYDAGVFCGFLKEFDANARKIILRESIRLHAWYGASLSQLAIEGTPDSSKCRFAMPLPEHVIMNVIEVIPCSTKAMENLKAVKSWTIK